MKKVRYLRPALLKPSKNSLTSLQCMHVCTCRCKEVITHISTKRVIDWRIWIECEQAVWSEQRWPNRTKQGRSTQHVRTSYKDSVKAVQKRQSPFPLQPLPVWGPVWSDSTPSTPTPDSIGFDQTITLTPSTLARDSPNRSCPKTTSTNTNHAMIKSLRNSTVIGKNHEVKTSNNRVQSLKVKGQHSEYSN